MEESRINLVGTLPLLQSAVIWGFAFVAQRASMEFVGPFTFTGIRFALGGLVLIPLIGTLRRNTSAPSQPAPSHHLWIAIGLAGLVLFVSANLQQIGLVHTPPQAKRDLSPACTSFSSLCLGCSADTA